MPSGMQVKSIFEALGLYTYPNQFSAPEGALSVAMNVVIDRPGIIESRADVSRQNLAALKTGATGYSGPFSPFGAIDNQIFASQCKSVYGGAGYLAAIGAFNGLYAVGNFSCTEVLAVSPSGATSSIGETFSSFHANGNNYFAAGGNIGGQCFTGSGKVFRVDQPNLGAVGTMRLTGAGMPQGLTCVDYAGTAGSGLTGLPTAAGSVMPINVLGSQRAYRVLYATKDAQLNLIRGAPSGRHIVYNGSPSAAKTYGLIIPLPSGQLYAGDIVQVYASEIAPALSSGGVSTGQEPSDNMAQIYEYILQSGDLTNGYITLQDQVSAAYGTALYTNDTQDGLALAENRPPDAALVTYHNNVAWYGAVQGKTQAAALSFLGLTGSSSGLGWTSGTTSVTLNGVTYTAATAEDLPNHKFLLSTSFGSAAQNISATAKSLARAISWNNQYLYAYYATPANSIQFQIVIKTLQVGDNTTYTLTTANLPSGTVSPTLPLALKEDAKTSRLYFSKPSQPEAVPDLNYLSIGSPDQPITGLASLRDSLFVFKLDGLYRVTGSTFSDIRVELFDATVSMRPGQHASIASAGNQVFALTNLGFVSCTESGVRLISGPIMDTVSPFTSTSMNMSTFAGAGLRYPWPCVAAATDTGKKYVAIITDVFGELGDAQRQYYYVYNFIGHSWVNWSLPIVATGICEVLGPTSGDSFLFSDGSGYYSSVYQNDLVTSYQPPAAGAIFAYCSEDSGNPGVVDRFYDVKVILESESSGITSMSCTFSSDSGAAPVTVTQSVDSTNFAVVFEVPKEHAQCGSLNYTISSPGSGRMVVQCVSLNYSLQGDRLPKARG